MTVKTILTALFTAVALGVAGAASVAQANDNGSGEYHGGFKIGPLGQHFGLMRGPALRFAYSPLGHRYYARHRTWHYEY
jgi:hypothetical protein